MNSTREKRPRSAGVDHPAASTAGLDSRRRTPKAASARSGVSRCMTCAALVDWIECPKARTWKPMDHGKDTPHRCAK